jgi:hypothetical protein
VKTKPTKPGVDFIKVGHTSLSVEQRAHTNLEENAISWAQGANS